MNTYTIKLEFGFDDLDSIREYGNILNQVRNMICLESECDLQTLSSIQGIQEIRKNLLT